MWNLGNRNRGIFVLISVLSGCAFLYNVWGPILALTLSIISVIYVCYSLLTNDTILSPQTFIFINYIKYGINEITEYLNNASFYLSSTIRKLYIILNNNYRKYVISKMNKFRQNTYQLSNDNRETTRNSSRFDLTTNQLSPISRNDYQENIYHNNDLRNNYSDSKHTSTPLLPLHQETNFASNGAIGLFTPSRPRRRESYLNYSQNQSIMKSNETIFSPEGSPWGTSISPKIRSKAASIKTVQTVAGPLLASTRYNIDPKVYSDVTSPGLSTRLAKYATEANNKLTHQSQYGTGQFPKVNLSASPLPLINIKNAKIRTPVTVRIAPPEASRYSPPERQKLISDACRAENRAAPSVVQVLREISLKRHASREDVSSDLVKKQRTEQFNESLDNLEDLKQKRSREDSPNTEEEILDRSSQLRPVKKTKTPSCFDVLNSLSSSNQYSSGVKRKASTLDLSRSGTPDIEKHFKASETDQAISKISVTVTEPEIEVRKPQKHDLNEKSSQSMEIEVNTKLREEPAARVKGILKSQIGKNTAADQQQNLSIEKHVTTEEKTEETKVMTNSSPVTNKPINFTDKLFMKAAPQTNERLRTLIQEQGNIRAKFTTDDVDEIKKEDIVNMRQTSMRARLQSMFDAISGKPAKKINPDVIIHAEGASESTTCTDSPASLVTLSSTTSTTNVNTSPIATSAVAPTVTDSKLNSTTLKKHVTFNLPSSQSTLTSQSSLSETICSPVVKTNPTEAGNLNSESPKLNFGTVLSSTTIPTTLSVGSSTPLSFPNIQSTNATSISAPSLVTSSKPSSAFIIPTSSVQNLIQSFGTPNVNVTSTLNNDLNSATTTTTVAKSLSPSSSGAFSSSNFSNVNLNTNAVSLAKPSPNLGAMNMPSPALSTGNSTSESNKLIDSSKTVTQTSVPMPNFSFGTPKTSTMTSFFAGNIQTSSVNTQNQDVTNNVSLAPTTTSSFVTSNVMQSQPPAFNATSTTGHIMAVNTPAATASLFPFSGSNPMPISANTGTFSFTTNTSSIKTQIPTFGNSSAQNTTAFGGTATQNPPAFGNTINFQNVQPSANITTTTAQNPPMFGTNNQNPPAFGSVVTTAENSSTFGSVATSAPPPSFGSTSTTNSTFAFGNIAAQTSTVSGFATNTNSVAQSTVASSTTNPTFSFGSTATASTKSNFAFGSNAPITTASNPTIGATGTSNQIPAFGAAAGSSITPVFGAPATTAPPAFGAASTTATPVFGAPANTTTSVFGVSTTTAPPAFGTTSSSTVTSLFGSPATTTTSAMFDGSNNQPTFGTASSSVAPSSFGTPKTTAPPAFGSHTSETGFSYGGGMAKSVMFGGTNLATTSNTAAPATATSTFGGNAVAKSVFGQTKAPPSFAASTSAVFGTSGTPSFGNTGSTFGANSSSIPAGTASGFGTQSTTTPAFGTQNTAGKQTPQAPPPAFGSTNSAFGTTTTAPPAFGANTATSSGFGTATTSFGTQNSIPPPSFGASTGNPAPPAFGANVSAPFGGQTQNSNPTFGTQNSTTPIFGTTYNKPSTGFGLEGIQSQTQQNSGFPFTSTTSNANNNTATVAPFQFGGTTAKSEGFNFNASTTTPNMNFGAAASSSFGTPNQGGNIFNTQSPAVPAGGMFSIGAGSTAPRSRSRTTRRQR